MDLKDEIIDVDYAKKFKSLGISQESPFQWVEIPKQFTIDLNLTKKITETEIKLVFGKFSTITDKINEWAAFTIGQIFKMLPERIDTKKDEPFNYFTLHVSKRNKLYFTNYFCDTHYFKEGVDPFVATNLIQEVIFDEKLANALAKLIIALKEKGY